MLLGQGSGHDGILVLLVGAEEVVRGEPGVAAADAGSDVLRQYLPRHVSMRDYSQADLDAIAAELNGRPRQTLGFKTPSEALTEALR